MGHAFRVVNGVRASGEPLSALLTRYGSDKDTDHSYGPIYDRLFAPVRESARLVLELGIGGGAGLRALRDYFPGAVVVGLDVDPSRLFTENRIATYAGRQGYALDLLALPVAGSLDVVIDDACHHLSEQLFSLACLWPRLASSGLYCIEDVCDPADAERFRGWPGATVHDLRRHKGKANDILIVLRKDP